MPKEAHTMYQNNQKAQKTSKKGQNWEKAGFKGAF